MIARMKRYTKEEFFRLMGWIPNILAKRKQGRGLGARKRRRREAREKQEMNRKRYGRGWDKRREEHTREEWLRLLRGY